MYVSVIATFPPEEELESDIVEIYHNINKELTRPGRFCRNIHYVWCS